MPDPTYTILTAQFVEIDGTEVSVQGMEAAIEIKVDTTDLTNFKSGGWKTLAGTLSSGDLKVQIIWTAALVTNYFNKRGQWIPFKLRTNADAAIGVGNLEFRGNAVNTGFKVGGKVGELWQADLSWPTTGPVTLHTS